MRALFYNSWYTPHSFPQLGEATLYAAALELMEACIKKLNAMNAFQEQVRTCTCTYIHRTCVSYECYPIILQDHTHVHVAAWYCINLHMQMTCVRCSVIAKALDGFASIGLPVLN